MIGIIRFALAVSVVAYHFHPSVFRWTGPLAVFSFYTVSGFLISRVLTDSYAGRPMAFIANRGLRLFPAYYLAAALGLLAAATVSSVNPALTIPDDPGSAIRQITIFGLLTTANEPFPIRLVPVAWSLNMELVWYLAMIPLVRVPRTWLVLASIPAALFIVTNDFRWAYYSVAGPALCLALGAYAYLSGYRPGR